MKEDRLLIPYETKLLEWIKDINWPGAGIIFERLIRYDGDKFQAQIEVTCQEAKRAGDESFMNSLKELSRKREMQVRDRAAENIKRLCLIVGNYSINELNSDGIELVPDVDNTHFDYQLSLFSKTDQELYDSLWILFECLMIESWAGTEAVYHRLLHFQPTSWYNYVLASCLAEAEVINDTVWAEKLISCVNQMHFVRF